MSRRINTDQLSITQDEAVELCAHHLRLAALFYQSTPEDAAAVRGEILRILRTAEHSDALEAAGAFLRAIEDYYRQLKEEIA